MQILALEQDVPGVTGEQFRPHLKDEAAHVWALHQAGTIRQAFFRADETRAVLLLECADAAEAEAVLATMPLVRGGLITFEIVPLVAYPGFARLFADAP